MLSAELLQAVIHRLRLVRKAYNKKMREDGLPEVCSLVCRSCKHHGCAVRVVRFASGVYDLITHNHTHVHDQISLCQTTR
jgi:hypothetical protein